MARKPASVQQVSSHPCSKEVYIREAGSRHPYGELKKISTGTAKYGDVIARDDVESASDPLSDEPFKATAPARDHQAV